VEGGAAVLADDHLAVEDGVVALEAGRQLGQLGEPVGGVRPRTAPRLRVPPDTVATMRNPSHLTSAAQPSPEGTLPLLASIGARAGGRTPGSLSLTDVAG
jgi:hypothetical protein